MCIYHVVSTDPGRLKNRIAAGLNNAAYAMPYHCKCLKQTSVKKPGSFVQEFRALLILIC